MSGTITHSWNGTVLTVTSDSGTSSADLKGAKGDTGIRGPQGAAHNETGKDISSNIGYIVENSIENGQLVTNVIYDEATIDSVYFRGMSLKDIFETNSIIQGGDFENGMPTINGVPAIYNKSTYEGIKAEGAEIGNYTLAIDAKPTETANGEFQYIQFDAYKFLHAHNYAWFMRLKIDEYTQGRIGIQSYSNLYANTELTGGAFKTVSHNFTVSQATDGYKNQKIYLGCMANGSLNPVMKAYIDNVSYLDLTNIFGEDLPSHKQIEDLYNLYIQLKKGNGISRKYLLSDITLDTSKSDEECIARFLQEMNAYATKLDMNNTYFNSASGLPLAKWGNNRMTSADLLKMGIVSFGYKDLVDVSCASSRDVIIYGDKARVKTVTNAMKSNQTGITNYIFGGKGGSLSAGSSSGQGSYGIKNYFMVVEANDTQIAVALMGAYHDEKCMPVVKDILDIITELMNGTSMDAITIGANLQAAITREEYPMSVSACVMPSGSIAAYAEYPLDRLLAKNTTYKALESASHVPASVSKIMTAMVVLDNVADINQRVEIKESDLISGSGAIFEAGDIVSYKDLLYAMLLPSSNQAAQALARNVGRILLER